MRIAAALLMKGGETPFVLELAPLQVPSPVFVAKALLFQLKQFIIKVATVVLASPALDGKTLILVDPMLATGTSMDLAYRALLIKGKPAHIHVAAAIASQQAVDYVKAHFPESTTVWVGAIDPVINDHSYIVPGLGDAGDLAFGVKD